MKFETMTLLQLAVWVQVALVNGLFLFWDWRRVEPRGWGWARWALLGVLIGPISWWPYWRCRGRHLAAQVRAAWDSLGPTEHTAAHRRERLRTLYRLGLVTPQVHDICAEALDLGRLPLQLSSDLDRPTSTARQHTPSA